MQELMFELLTYEPFGKFLPEEKKYIHDILFEIFPQPQSMIHDLFSGFYHYVQSKKFKDKAKAETENKDINVDLGWLRQWKEKYTSSKSKRFKPPLLFKKICFYVIVWEKNTDKEFMGFLDLRINLVRKWGISPQFRKYAEEDTYSVIKSYRSGAKKSYIVSIVKRLYYEAGLQVNRSKQLKKENQQVDQLMLFKKAYRQVKQSMTLSKLPTFVDVFAGTASVAASMGAYKGFPPPIVNDYDPVIVCFIWAFTYCQRELRKRIAGFHNDLMKQDFKSTSWSYSESSYEESIDPKSLLTSPKIWDDPKTQWSLMEFQGYSKEEIEGGRILAQRYQ